MELPSEKELRSLLAPLHAQARALESLLRHRENPSAAQISSLLSAFARSPTPPSPAMLESLQEWIRKDTETRREKLAQDLRDARERLGLDIRALSRDPLHLRISPFEFLIDFAKNEASLRWARQELTTCPATAAEIFAAREHWIQTLNTSGWSPESHHALLRRAYQRLGPDGGWVSLHEVHYELFTMQQPKEVRQDPHPERMVPYSKAQFVWDIQRLQRSRQLLHGGWRVHLAAATGASTRYKSQVFWLEDDVGQGQYYRSCPKTWRLPS